MESSSEVVNNIVNSVEVAQREDEFIAPNGVKFKLKKFPKMLIVDAIKKLHRPKIPVVFIDEKGREEENPADPDYIERVQEYDATRGSLVSNIITSFGSEVLDYNGFPEVQSEEWTEDFIDLGIDIPKKGKARYSAWVKYLCLTDEDFIALTIAISRFNGITMEKDVENAVNSFRGDSTRDSLN